ncbi:hypothetical protein B566_EDAN000891 [Ephemera danica]|nr:hypothetical protein B566_EDAN000891 [Ephemera danica]
MNLRTLCLKMERWSGRVALVTGAGSGIGEAIAGILSENGMKVVAADLNLSRVEALAAQAKKEKKEIHPIQCDVTKDEDVVRVVKWTREKLGGADVLVNCAGLFYSVNLTDVSAEKLRKIFDVNVVGLSLCTREVVKDMRDRGVDDGHIFHMSSASGQRIPNLEGIYLYSASKHSVMVLTEGLRRELRDLKTKIKITGISPGMTRTNIIEASGIPKAEADQFYNSIKYLLPRDIAEALLYALSTPPHVQALAEQAEQQKREIHPNQCDVTKEEDVVKWTKEKLGGADEQMGLVQDLSGQMLPPSGLSKAEADEFFNGVKYLLPRDIAEALLYALSSPPHVQVNSFYSFLCSTDT